ncbi:MAG: hypothetical protein HXN50_07645 [Prevotella nanceiensis]|nr:hypothetical protein [Hoylesella nanceiensis]
MLAQLDSFIKKREYYVELKERQLDLLKASAKSSKDDIKRLKLYNEIYDNYNSFVYDSAMTYVNKGFQLAKTINNPYYTTLNQLHKALLLGTRGFYHEAISSIADIKREALEPQLRFEYDFTLYRVYGLWGEYCTDSEYASQYEALKIKSIEDALEVVQKETATYYYMLGEYTNYKERDMEHAEKFYLEALRRSTPSDRLYASAAFMVAYCNTENNATFEEYLIKAAISDIVRPTKDNIALQDLAVHLLNNNPKNIERAERYINISMEDARFYNNRLRTFEISSKLPIITSTYKEVINKQNTHRLIIIAIITLLSVSMIISLIFIIRQNNLLKTNKKELSSNNELLQELNERLLQTNNKREELAKLYIGLCAKYIDKLTKYQSTVKRKIMANRVNELLTKVSSSRMSEEDAAVFMARFDKAFLALYPSFIEELSALLQPSEQVSLESDGTMSTKLRIFALIRLGIKESSEIATLLFYSPQTIYNYRSAMKKSALNPDSFEDDVRHLCIMVHNDKEGKA